MKLETLNNPIKKWIFQYCNGHYPRIRKWWSALFLQLHCLSSVVFSIYCLSWLALVLLFTVSLDFLISDFIFKL